MANVGVNFSSVPSYVHIKLLSVDPTTAATSVGQWINIGEARGNPVIFARGIATVTVGVEFETYLGDDTPTTTLAGININATITAAGDQATTPSAILGPWIRAVCGPNTAGAGPLTVEAFYFGTKAVGRR